MPWIGKYWSSRSTVASGAAVTRRDAMISAARCEHRRPPQHEPDLVRHPLEQRRDPLGAPRGRARAASRRTRAGPRRPPASTAARCAAVQVHTHTDVDRRDAARRASRPARRRGGWATRAARSRVGVVGRGRARRRRAPPRRAAAARSACTVPMWPQPTRPIRIIVPSALGPSTSDAGSDRARPEAVAHRVDRALDRGAALVARRVVGCGVVVEVEHALLDAATGRSSCDSDTPSSRTPRPTSKSRRAARARSSSDDRAERGRRRAACGRACASRSCRSGTSA